MAPSGGPLTLRKYPELRTGNGETNWVCVGCGELELGRDRTTARTEASQVAAGR